MSNTHAGCNAVTPSDASSTLDYLPLDWDCIHFHTCDTCHDKLLTVHVVLQTVVVQPQPLHHHMHATAAL
jgi:hypothetical protein